MTAPTLTEFLLARIADDERWAQMAGHGFGHQPLRAKRNAGWTDIDLSENCRPSYDAGFIERQSPERVLRDCKARRAIVAEVERLRPLIPEYVIGDGDERELVIVEWAESAVLSHLASVYADHPDYREEWRA